MNAGDKVIWKQATGKDVYALTPARVLAVRPQRVRILVQTRRGQARLWVPAAAVHLAEVRGLEPETVVGDDQIQPETVEG